MSWNKLLGDDGLFTLTPRGLNFFLMIWILIRIKTVAYNIIIITFYLFTMKWHLTALTIDKTF